MDIINEKLDLVLGGIALIQRDLRQEIAIVKVVNLENEPAEELSYLKKHFKAVERLRILAGGNKNVRKS